MRENDIGIVNIFVPVAADISVIVKTVKRVKKIGNGEITFADKNLSAVKAVAESDVSDKGAETSYRLLRRRAGSKESTSDVPAGAENAGTEFVNE